MDPDKLLRAYHPAWMWAIVLSSMFIAAVAAGEGQPTIWIAGWERWPAATARDGNGSAGELLWSELRCGACHAVPSEWSARLTTPPAPQLERVTSRTRVAYLRRFLASPVSVQPSAWMPHMLHNMDDHQRAAVVERLLHFLASLGGPAHEELPIVGSAKRGEELFRSVGCVACHTIPVDGESTGPSGYPLNHVLYKYTLGGLTSFLHCTLQVWPSGRMPEMGLTVEEARSIAAYLLRLPETYRVRYAYYEGRWSELPDFRQHTPVEIGGSDRIDLSMARRRDFIAIRFEGNIRVDQSAIYTFRLASDDGSRLWIDERVVIDNDGVHAAQEKVAQVKLDAGIHSVRIDFFEHAGEEMIRCEVEGPNLSRRRIEELLVSTYADTAMAQAGRGQVSIEVDASLAIEGRQLFQTLGCAACHTVGEHGDRASPPARPGAPPAVALRPDQGCLAEHPPPSAPRYMLSGTQRMALGQLLSLVQRPPQPISKDAQVARTLAAFACYACHERNGIGGVNAELNVFFQTTTPEMGDEGRIPPSLNGVGGKLTLKWLNKTLAEGAKDRPYMLTRMPKFGSNNVGQLADLLAELDRLPPIEPPRFPVPMPEVKAAGWAMVGEGGFGCIKCHTFGTFPAQGIQSINLQLMHDRLRPEWFHRYMRNPAAFRPGTRMPSAWPPQGPSLLEYLGADSELQIAAIWAYLSDGERARVPPGVVTPSMELVPIQHAIIYRNFIAGAGSRAIAVGFPEGIHMAFDAENACLALLWQGRFIDASRHWTGRGEGFQPPAGEKVLRLVDGVALAYLSDRNQPWPSQSARQLGYRFLGYRTTPDQRPTFLYQFSGVQIEDHLDLHGVGRADPVPRVLTFRCVSPHDHAPGELWFRVAAGRIAKLAEQRYRVDGTWQVEVVAPTESLLRHSGGRDELLVRVPCHNPPQTIKLLYSW